MVSALLLLALWAQGAAFEKPEDPPQVSTATATSLRSGRWRAVLDCPAGELPFILDLGRVPEGWIAWVSNGKERFQARIKVEGPVLHLAFDPYPSEIVARITREGRRLDGEWILARGSAEPRRMTFHADQGGEPRFQGKNKTERSGPRLEGTWAVVFDGMEDMARASFEEGPHTVTGTIETTLGDYRFLEGVWEDGLLRLSTFDGAHAFLFVAQLGSDGRLGGVFTSGNHHEQAFTAWRDPNAALADPFSQVSLRRGASLEGLSYLGPDGKEVVLTGREFEGKARILVLFGTWCPNCVDEARVLAELQREFGTERLSIVGLAFEQKDTKENQLARIEHFRDALQIPYPLLLAGDADKASVPSLLPLIESLRAFPTTIFLDRDGRPRAVHSGFAGPATGKVHEHLVDRFRLLIPVLLDPEPDTGGGR